MELKVIKALLRFMRPCLWATPLLVTLGIVASFAEGVGIGLLIPFLDARMLGESGDSKPGPFIQLIRGYAANFTPETRQIALGMTILVLITLKSILIYMNGVLSSEINGRVSHSLRVELLQKFSSGRYELFINDDPTRLFNVIRFHVWKTTDAIHYFISFIVSGCTAVIFGLMLLLISWQLTLGVAVGLLFIQVIVTLLTRRAERSGKAAVQADNALAEYLGAIIAGMRVVRAFSQEFNVLRDFTYKSDQVRQAFQRSEFVTVAVHPLLELLHVPLFLASLLVAWHAEIGLSTVLAFLLLLYRTQPYLRGLDSNRVQLNNHASIVIGVADELERWNDAGIRVGALPFTGLNRSICFRGVGFCYRRGDDCSEVLADVSFDVRAGEITAIVGPSGAGKSTLINLLYRFYNPDVGEILVDGQPLHAFDISTWRSRLAIAGQDTQLIGGTVREAIAFGRPDASEADILEAACRANAHAFVDALPSGYDSPVGSGGIQLSGGQRQRIALARALLRRPDILILDEATNALDSASEAAVQDALLKLAGTLTVIVIAHRLSAIRSADRVLVLDNGRVVEYGTPGELLDADGQFARLYNS